VAKTSLAVVDEYGLLEVVTEELESLVCECVTSGRLPVEVVDDAPQSNTTSTETDPDEGRLNGLPFWSTCSPVTQISRLTGLKELCRGSSTPRGIEELCAA
jgi:hypothetical protein